ncbi:MAG: response regulator, partial [Bdellovibrionales bacterium]|nr:response regulator [Bdellovibrionales bacterium]
MNIRNTLRDLDLSKKLLILMGLSTILAVGLSITALSILNYYAARHEFQSKVVVSSEVMARNTIVALSFSDEQVANENLASLTADETIAAAVIYDERGKLFASYIRSDTDRSRIPPRFIPTSPTLWTEGALKVTVPLLGPEGEIEGNLVVIADTTRLNEVIGNAFLAGGILLLVIGILSIFLSSFLQSLISSPILGLLRFIETVTQSKNYSAHALCTSHDEVGRLVDGFNNMLVTIEEGNRKLAEHRSQLELEVAERTKDLRASEAHVRAILDNAGEGMLTVDAGGKILMMNPAAMSLFGCDGNSPSSLYFSDILAPDVEGVPRISFESLRRMVSEGEKSVQCDLKGGDRIFPAHLSVGIIEGEDGDQYICVVSDITSFRKAEEMLRASRDAAYAASKAKSEFLANMSHEIRTPMNAVIGMSELCLDTSLNSVQYEYISTVLESAKALLSLLNDILDFSKIEAGKFKINTEEFNIRDLIHSTVRTLAPRFHNTEVELLCDIDPTLNGNYRGDQGRIRQVLVNLIGNAAKFTHEGEVILSVRRAGNCEEEGREQIEFAVRDTGIGIPDEKQNLIFEAFSQVDSSTTRLYGGTGLGLTISSQLAHMMGGRISLESVFGIGSTFSLTVPLAPSGSPLVTIHPTSLEAIRGLRVLVVDDNATNRRILEQALVRELETQVTVVEGGQQALACLGSTKSDAKNFDLIITDFQMPFMDGAEFIRRMRRLPSAKEIPVLVLSSVDLRLSEEKFKHLGIRTTLLKPVLSETLVNGIQTALGTSRLNVDSLRPMIEERIKNRIRKFDYSLNILVVEDNRVNQKLVKQVLAKRGHDVIVAENGQVALTILKEKGELNTDPTFEEAADSGIDLVLMDIQMPIMGGVEATQRIREIEQETGRH